MNLSELLELTPDDLLNLPEETQQDVLQRVYELKEYHTNNKLHFFQPFPYQERFEAAGATYKTRFLRAGNRTGKTYGAAAEFAMHLTGEYPADWQGEIVPESGHVYWVIGITLSSAANVIQKELFGTNDCRDKSHLGTGMIPKRCIITEQGWQPDGACLRQCLIRHKDGGTNTLAFWGSENEAVMMGAKVRYVWMDEENQYTSLAIYSQCQTRLLNAAGEGLNGSMIITATPEGGKTPLNALFEKNEGGKLYLQQASMDDNPTFTEEQIEEFLSKIPMWQRAMRRHGLPVLGNTAVFQISDDDIRAENVTPLNHWRVVQAIDVGEKTDPTVLTQAFHDPDNDVYYIYKQTVLDQDAEARSATGIARAVNNSEFMFVPLVVPHDAGLKSDDPLAVGKLLQRLGVNVYPEPFTNPYETQLKANYGQTASNNVRKIATGLNEMEYLFREERLKVNASCHSWFKEKQNYYLKVNKNTGSVSYAGDDHCIDSSRYAIMSLMRGIGCYWGEASNPDASQLQTFDTIQFN